MKQNSRKEQFAINLNKSNKQSQNRKIITKFLDEVPDTLGWWYRIPKLSQEWNNTQLKAIRNSILERFGS